jgi:hypothetical protein
MTSTILAYAADTLRAALATGDAATIRAARREAFATMRERPMRGPGFRDEDVRAEVEAREALETLYRESETALAPPAVRCIVEVKGAFGGGTGGWRPAATGTENQTGRADAEASTFDDFASAEAYCDHLIQTYCDEDDALSFRVRALD